MGRPKGSTNKKTVGAVKKDKIVEQNSLELFDKIVKEQMTQDYEIYKCFVGNEQIELKIKKHISIIETMQAVKEIVGMVFTDDDDRIDSFIPVSIDLAKGWAVLKYFGGIVINDVGKLWDIVCQTNIVSSIMEIAGAEAANLCLAADSLIELRKKKIAYGGILGNLSGMLQGVADETKDMFKDINPEELSEIVTKLKGLDTKEIVENILDHEEGKKIETPNTMGVMPISPRKKIKK